MVKRKKLFIVSAIAVNIVIVALMIIVLSTYSIRTYNSNKQLEKDVLADTTRSMSDTIRLYFQQQQKSLISRKNYITEKSLSTIDEAMEYIRISSSDDKTVYQLIDCENMIGKSISLGADVVDIEYSDAYEIIREVCDDVHNDNINDEVINITAYFTNPFDGALCLAFYTVVDIASEKYAFLAVVDSNKFVDAGLPKPDYQDAGAAIVRADGDYVIKTAAYKSQNIYEFFRSYSKLSFVESQDIRTSVLESDNGVLSYMDSRGKKCLYFYQKMEYTNNCYYFTLVPENLLVSDSVDYLFMTILVAFIIVLVLADGGIILYLVNLLRANLSSEIVARTFAENASVAKSGFLSRMSHEIRTPLNALIGYLIISRKALSNDEYTSEEKNKKFLDCVVKSEVAAEHLLSIINDVLDMSAIESNKMKLQTEEFSFKDLIRDLYRMFFSMASNKGVNFDITIDNVIDEVLIGDLMRTKQIIGNLLSNAIKFTDSGGSVTLLIGQTNSSNKETMVSFAVKDSGIGIDEKALESIWSPFEQANDEIASRYGGTGLGLSITKKIVDMMNGTITVESKVGVGSTFRINMPCQRANTSLYQNKNCLDKSVLIIDYKPDAHKYIPELLSCYKLKFKYLEGYSVVEEELKKDKFSLCILYCLSFGFQEKELVEKIKLHDDEMIVAVINEDDYGDGDATLYQGVDKIISKPLFFSSVYNLLDLYNKEGIKTPITQVNKYDFSGYTVLLVEDNEMNMEIATEILQSVGIKVEQAYNGIDAVEMFSSSDQNKYDLILMDVQMTGMDGYMATGKIRESKLKRAKQIPIVAMTSNVFSEDIKAAKAAGMDAHIAKPIDLNNLFQTLSVFLNNKTFK